MYHAIHTKKSVFGFLNMFQNIMSITLRSFNYDIIGL